jgi:hypothetical protein
MGLLEHSCRNLPDGYGPFGYFGGYLIPRLAVCHAESGDLSAIEKLLIARQCGYVVLFLNWNMLTSSFKDGSRF